MPKATASAAGVIALMVGGLIVSGCAAGRSDYAASSLPLSPLYNVTPDMLRPDGTMTNGLLPIDPNDQQ